MNCSTKTVAKCADCGLAYCAQCYALVTRCPQCAAPPVPSPLVSAAYADSDEEVGAAGQQEVVSVGSHSNAALVPVASWSPSPTEQLWLDFISKSTPGLAQDVLRFLCTSMARMGFIRVRDFQSLHASQLEESRNQWPQMTDEVWLQVKRLRQAVIPAAVKPQALVKAESGCQVLGVQVSPASQVVGMLKSSITVRSSRVLRQMLGLRDSDPLPKPQNLLDMFRKCVPVALM